jgi:putative DNA primase/helicase
MQYIILNDKSPTHKFKDGEGAKTWDEVKDYENVAVIVPDGYVVLDFDTTSDAEIMLKIVDALDLKTRVMKTTRGIHCWFKSPEESPKNFIKQRLAVGIIADRKAGGRNAYVKVKQDGKTRQWLKKVKYKDIEVVPKWLTAVSAPSGKFAFKDMGDGSGRNQELFNYIVYLQTKGFTKDEIKQTIEIINNYVLLDPLSDTEIATICRDEAFKPDDVIAEQIAEAEKRSTFSHISVAEEIISEHRLIKYNGVTYEYYDNYYQPAEFLRKYVRETYRGAKNNQVNEVVSYISDMKEIRRGSLKPDPYILNLENTRLNIKTGECLPFDPDVIEFDRIPVTYDPSAYCADLDKMLNRVFLGDREVINLFGEMLGAVLLKHNRYQKAFLFCGRGSNGKSTILDLIKLFLGLSNYSTLSLEEVTGRFNRILLEHKRANIGDDIDNVAIKDTGTLKKMIAGNAITVEIKGGISYPIEPYATHIYSANEIPRSFDKSDGFYRRWLIIPFNARFSVDDEDYDPLIGDKITTPTALSYLLNIGIQGANRLMRNGKFTEPKTVVEALETYEADNSNVLSWIEDKELDDDYMLDKSRDELYAEFVDWCKLSGIKSGNISGKKTFFREVIQKFEFDEKPSQKSGGKRYFKYKL